ncbi:MAG TPA: hypothetical protein VEU96_20665 [Bryobacteraceae bacterium]|nr:hypothetical protein [Bryobacteraceae bacterium]
MADLMENLAATVQDAKLRLHIERLFHGLDKIETEVLPVGRARSVLKEVRERVTEGGAALIADRGVVQHANETTVMISLETFQRLIVDIIAKSAQSRMECRMPVDIMIGLNPVPSPASSFTIDFDAAGQEPDRAGADIQL